MKSFNRLPFVFLIFLLLLGCNIKSQRQKNQEFQDSIARIEKRNKEIRDSLEQVRIDSLSLIAWGDAKFGMSQKEVLATNAFKGSTIYSNETVSMAFENRNIANTKMTICDFYAEFEMDKLYRVEIKTCPETANYIDDLETDIIRISRQFEKKYGKPAYSFNREIGLSNFNEGDEFVYKRWEIGTKSIYIQFGEVYSGSEYYYRIIITNSNYPTKRDIKKEERYKQAEKAEREKEKYQF